MSAHTADFSRFVSPRTKQATGGLAGAGLGALAGLATSERGNRNKAVGRGAAIGAGTELGGLAGLVPGGLVGALAGYLSGGDWKSTGLGAMAGAGVGGVSGGVLGNMAARGLVGPYKKDTPEDKHTEDSDEKSANAVGAFLENLKPREFLAKLNPNKYHGAFSQGQLLAMPLVGAGLGGLGGMTFSKPKNRLRNALVGALAGAGVGGGASLGYMAGEHAYGNEKLVRPLMPLARANGMEQNPFHNRGLLGAVGGAGLAGGIANDLLAGSKDDEEERRSPKYASAREFGEKLAVNARLQGGLGGLAIGAGLGGLAGALNPGHDEVLDDEGNLVKRRKSRLMAALGGALGGGAIGGVAGRVAGHFNPELVNNLSSRAQGLYGLGQHKVQELLGKAPSYNAASVSPEQLARAGATV